MRIDQTTRSFAAGDPAMTRKSLADMVEEGTVTPKFEWWASLKYAVANAMMGPNVHSVVELSVAPDVVEKLAAKGTIYPSPLGTAFISQVRADPLSDEPTDLLVEVLTCVGSSTKATLIPLGEASDEDVIKALDDLLWFAIEAAGPAADQQEKMVRVTSGLSVSGQSNHRPRRRGARERPEPRAAAEAARHRHDAADDHSLAVGIDLGRIVMGRDRARLLRANQAGGGKGEEGHGRRVFSGGLWSAPRWPPGEFLGGYEIEESLDFTGAG
jgi:hypothetical protein